MRRSHCTIVVFTLLNSNYNEAQEEGYRWQIRTAHYTVVGGTTYSLKGSCSRAAKKVTKDLNFKVDHVSFEDWYNADFLV